MMMRTTAAMRISLFLWLIVLWRFSGDVFVHSDAHSVEQIGSEQADDAADYALHCHGVNGGVEVHEGEGACEAACYGSYGGVFP